MKISNKEKEKNRKKIIAAAVEVITGKGFKAATMREISKKAGLSEAAIYNYFPAKEKLVFAYYADAMNEAERECGAVRGFASMTLREKFHLFIEANLQKYLNARGFVAETFAMAFAMPFFYATDARAIRDAFVAASRKYLEEAVANAEIPQQPFGDLMAALSWDYYVLAVTFWLKDDSEGFASTTAMIDKSLAVKEAILQSGVIPKGVEFISFMMRTSLGQWMDRWPRAAAAAAGKTKAEGTNARRKGRRR